MTDHSNLLLGLAEVHELLDMIVKNKDHDIVLILPKHIRTSNVLSVQNRLKYIMKEIEFLQQDLKNGDTNIS